MIRAFMADYEAQFRHWRRLVEIGLESIELSIIFPLQLNTQPRHIADLKLGIDRTVYRPVVRNVKIITNLATE